MTPLLCACAVVITLETQKCRKRAPSSVELFFLLIAIHHSSLRHPEAFAPPPTSWLESGSATGVDISLVGLVRGPERRRIESGKKLVFTVSEWLNVPASLLATQSLWRSFCMRVRGSSRRIELRHDVFAQAPSMRRQNFERPPFGSFSSDID